MIGPLTDQQGGPRPLEFFSAVDSVDSVKLAEKLDGAARAMNKKLSVLIEINIGGEAAKSGVAPGFAGVRRVAAGCAAPVKGSNCEGLMTVPPFTDDPEGARPYFSQAAGNCGTRIPRHASFPRSR